MKKLISENVILSCEPDDVESLLKRTYGSIIRWAIVDVTDNGLKIEFTCEK